MAAFVCTLIFARPALMRLAGAPWERPEGLTVPAAFGKEKRAGRREYLRARLDAEGRAEVFASEGSGRISGLSWARGLVELEDGARSDPAGRPGALPAVRGLRALSAVASRLLTRPALHTAGVYVTLFMVTGVQMPFWPLWLADWGLTPEEVGLYTALGVAVRVVAGMAVPALADRLDRRRDTMVACTALTLVLYLAHLGIERKAVLLAATLAVGAAMAGIGPLPRRWGWRRRGRGASPTPRCAASARWGFSRRTSSWGPGSPRAAPGSRSGGSSSGWRR